MHAICPRLFDIEPCSADLLVVLRYAVIQRKYGQHQQKHEQDADHQIADRGEVTLSAPLFVVAEYHARRLPARQLDVPEHLVEFACHAQDMACRAEAATVFGRLWSTPSSRCAAAAISSDTRAAPAFAASNLCGAPPICSTAAPRLVATTRSDAVAACAASAVRRRSAAPAAKGATDSRVTRSSSSIRPAPASVVPASAVAWCAKTWPALSSISRMPDAAAANSSAASAAPRASASPVLVAA